MQTSLPDPYRLTPRGRRAESILRSCVHCGFCNATCPTYQVLGDELDGPRGRIYLIKDMLETQQTDEVVVTHLDRCLTCRACETTCPSGVAYGELLEIGRDFVETHHRRGTLDRLTRNWLRRVVPHPEVFNRWMRLGRFFRFLLPRRLASQISRPAGRAAATPVAASCGKGRVLLLDGCVQRLSTPDTNQALKRLLADAGVEVVSLADEQCCGGLSLHLGAQPEALDYMRGNLDAIGPVLGEVDAVISTASGCGVTLKDYERLLENEERHAGVARAFSRKVMDVGEYLLRLGVGWGKRDDLHRIALHLPCTLQHGMGLSDPPRQLLEAAGYELVPVQDAHLCCGSAGTYSMLQPELAGTLRARKLECLQAQGPEIIATANVGCQMHLATEAGVSVVHWMELLVSPSAEGSKRVEGEQGE
ncbi:MAG: glycolate oxidase subunit GlcF [Pseudomonadales bacterium]